MQRGSTVTQVSNLLYRRLPACRTLSSSTVRALAAPPIGNRRYSRLETCATWPASECARPRAQQATKRDGARKESSAMEQAKLAAPEDGRTPIQSRRLMVRVK